MELLLSHYFSRVNYCIYFDSYIYYYSHLFDIIDIESHLNQDIIVSKQDRNGSGQVISNINEENELSMINNAKNQHINANERNKRNENIVNNMRHITINKMVL